VKGAPGGREGAWPEKKKPTKRGKQRHRRNLNERRGCDQRNSGKTGWENVEKRQPNVKKKGEKNPLRSSSQ